VAKMSKEPIAFQVLGPTVARQGGRAIPLSGARRRALVTRLLLDAGRAVSADALLEDVWGEQAPAAASATLQSHVSQLRKVLGDRLERTAVGYVLRLDAASVDAREFEDMVGSGSSQIAAGDFEAAAWTLRQALRLWRGRALDEVADQPWARPEAERLEELRRVATEQLLEARLALGEHEHVVPDAKLAVEQNPLREQRWATLMLALYRCGRQVDALRAYQRLRNLLVEELGIDPSPPIAALEAAILRHDPALQLPMAKIDGGGRPTRVESESHFLYSGIAHFELGMVHLALGEVGLARQSFHRARTCGANGQPGRALLELNRGNVVAAAESIRVALAEPCEDELRRVLLLSGAVEIFLASGDDAEVPHLVQQLEDIAGQLDMAGAHTTFHQSRTTLTTSSAAD
jgi:DNA-binding SARP family transcriptional activator